MYAAEKKVPSKKKQKLSTACEPNKTQKGKKLALPLALSLSLPLQSPISVCARALRSASSSRSSKSAAESESGGGGVAESGLLSSPSLFFTPNSESGRISSAISLASGLSDRNRL